FVQRAGVTAAGFGILRNIEACAPSVVPVAGPPAPTILPGTFAELRDQYFLFHLDKNPVTSTYLGGDGYSPLLATTNTRLRDFSQASIDAEVKYYRGLRASIDLIPPASLTVRERADQQLMAAQLGFLIHQMSELKHYQR